MDARKVVARFTALAAAALGLIGCVRTETHAVVFDPPERAGGVAVYVSRRPASGRELGPVSVRGGIGIEDNDVRDLYKEAVRQTKALGGNALVIESISTDVKGERPAYKGDDQDPACDVGCSLGVEPKSIKETMTVELRGKALRLPPAEPPPGRGP